VPGLLLEPGAIGFFTKPGNFGIQPGIGFRAHALHFFAELVGRSFLGRHARFLCSQLAQGLGFELRLRLCETRFGRFLPKPIELAAKTGFRLFADACDLALEGAGGGFVRSLAGFLRCDVALTIGLALGLLLGAAALLGFDPDAFELGTETRIGLGFDAGDFGFEGAGGGLLRGTLRFLRCRLAQRLRFDRALRLFVLRLLTQMFELAFQTRVGFAANACDLGLDRARGRFFGGALGVLRGLLAGLLGIALRLLLRTAGLVGVFADALEFGFETSICVAADARDFGLGCRGSRLLCGIARLTRATWLATMGDQPVTALWGIGERTAARLVEAGIRTVNELAHTDHNDLAVRFGPMIGPIMMPMPKIACAFGRSCAG